MFSSSNVLALVAQFYCNPRYLCAAQCNARLFCAVTALLFITIQNDGLVGQVQHDRVSRGVTNHYSSTYNSDIHLKSYNSCLIVIIFYQKWPFIIHLYQRGGHPAFIHPLTIRIFTTRFAFWSEWNVLDWIKAPFGVAAPRFIIRTLHYCFGCHRPFALVVLLWVSTLSHLGGRIIRKKVWQSHISQFLF